MDEWSSTRDKKKSIMNNETVARICLGVGNAVLLRFLYASIVLIGRVLVLEDDGGQ